LARVTRRSAEIRLDGLLRTACDVIAERGLANTRTADVAKAAGVSQALVFYHFSTKERLLAQAFAWAAEQDLSRLDSVLSSHATPLVKLRRILKAYSATGSSKSWAMWIECRAESLRMPDLEKVSRRLDLRWRDALADVISAGVKDGDFVCDDPSGAAWRIIALIEGLSLTATVHERVISRPQSSEWVRLTTTRELGLEPGALNPGKELATSPRKAGRTTRVR
jgi:AcrR family transcriptional regulator